MNEIINENVALFYANNEYESITLINEINEQNKNNKFTCPICEGTVRPRAINSEKVSSHYYHLNAKDCSGEAVMHYWYKNEFLKKRDLITLRVENNIYTYKCEDVKIEQSHKTSFGLYRPDATIYTDKGMLFIEYIYINKKDTDKYLDIWEELNCPVVEIDINLLMECKRTDYNFKPIYFDGIVYCKNKNKRMDIVEKHVRDNNIKDRMRIKYLNGLLKDIQRYNLGQISIDDLVIIIDELNKMDLKALPIMLSKLSCTNVLNDYATYKERIVKEIIKKECKKQRISFEYAMDNIYFKYTRKFSEYTGTTKLKNSVVFKVSRSISSDGQIGENIYGKIVEEDVINTTNRYLKSIKSGYEFYKKYRIREKREKVIDRYFKEYLHDTYNFEGYYYEWYSVDKYSDVYYKYDTKGRKKKYLEYLDDRANNIICEVKNKNRIKERNKFVEDVIFSLSNEASNYISERYGINITTNENYSHIEFYCKELKRNIYSMYKHLDIFSYKKCTGRKSIIKKDIINRLISALTKQNCGIDNIKDVISIKENKKCITKVTENDDKVFSLEWFIITEKKYYEDETKKMLGEFIFDMKSNKITFAYKNNVFISYAKDNAELSLFIDVIQQKMVDYFTYHISSNKNEYKGR